MFKSDFFITIDNNIIFFLKLYLYPWQHWGRTENKYKITYIVYCNNIIL